MSSLENTSHSTLSRGKLTARLMVVGCLECTTGRAGYLAEA